MTIRLANPVPLEAAIQFRRHLLNIREAAGYNNSIMAAGVSLDPKNLENAGVSANKHVHVNTAWDLDVCQDLNVATRTNGITSYISTCFLSAFIYYNGIEVDGQQRARALFHADIVKYFFPAPGTANTHGMLSPWTLPTENGQKVIREFYINKLNYDADYQKKPIIGLTFELTMFWAALGNDLYYPA